MQDQTIQWLTVILGSLLFLDACRRVVTRHIVAGRVGGDTPRSCCRNDNRENGLVQAYTVLSLETCKWVVTRHVAASGVGAFPKSIRAIPQDIITCGGATLFGVSDTSIRSRGRGCGRRKYFENSENIIFVQMSKLSFPNCRSNEFG